MVSFPCLWDDKCEWRKGLKDFAIQFNEAFGKDYSLSKFLDISEKGGKQQTKQPEVLLEAPGDKPMVIECKKIVYPPKYYEKHRHFHYFFKDFYDSYNRDLKPILPQDVYEIGINENVLYQNKKQKFPSISNQIVAHVLQHIEEFHVSNQISSAEPIPWGFRRVPENERDDESYKSGLRLSSSAKSLSYQFDKLPEAEEEIAKELAKHLSNTDIKFRDYANCLKILVIEICGDILSIPSPEVIVEIIENATIPSSVDQIWLADPQDETESIISYYQIV
ncbi:hypothetical protein [Nostoc sp. NMS8]|uniref:hypothetical protein n=1 Tax=Nostoc sp. NMS8 TaxID=2815392 RepID=UPI0025E499A8|nr:hypothetical protein [Nostoc sp. NMS8]MBN3963594.1 hypothetical protein [Nostoc sp. NMS8]